MTEENQFTYDDLNRFDEIISEMKNLLKESFSITAKAFSHNSVEHQRMERYWFSHIKGAIENRAGGSMFTMENTLEEMEDFIASQEDNEEN